MPFVTARPQVARARREGLTSPGRLAYFWRPVMGTLSTVSRGWHAAAVLLLCTLAIGLACPGARAADVERHFDIPAQPLGTALDEFARQADVTLLFSSSLIGRARTAGVQGELAVTTAL